MIDDALVEKHAQQVIATMIKTGEQRYDIASALIKSIRGGDPNASVAGWLECLKVAKMLNLLPDDC